MLRPEKVKLPPATKGDPVPSLYTFAQLVQANAGVLLSPLVPDDYFERLDPDTTLGIAEVPRAVAHSIIEGHAYTDEDDGGVQRSVLIGRLRRVRNRADYLNRLPPLLGERVPVLKSPDKPKQPTLREVIQNLVFADPEHPETDNIPQIIKRNPTDPGTIHLIDRAFRDNGHVLLAPKSPGNKELTAKVDRAIVAGLNKYIFERPHYKEEKPIQRLVATWISRLDEAPSEFSQAIQIRLVTAVLGGVIEQVRDVTSIANFIRVVHDASVDLANRMEPEQYVDITRPIDQRVAALLRKLPDDQRAKLVKSLSSGPAIYKALVLSGQGVPVTELLRDAKKPFER